MSWYKSRQLYWFCFIVLFLIAAGVLYAAITTPNSFHNIDGWASETFKGSALMRSAAILTNAYVNTDIIDTSAYSGIGLYIDITQGSLASLEYQVWNSFDNVNWFVEATEAISAATITDTAVNYTITLSGNVKYFKVLPCYGAYIKLAVKGTGTLTASSCTISYVGVR